MRDIYLGDSYDIVKRFWADALNSFAPLYAHPAFVPASIRQQYNAITSIPILDPDRLPSTEFSLLLDPDVGIPFPSEASIRPTNSHAPVSFIVQVNEKFRPTCMICFDQSYHRSHELTREAQRAKKRIVLKEHGIRSFYYVSHAPFLFMAGKQDNLNKVFEQLVSVGIPRSRLEPQIIETEDR